MDDRDKSARGRDQRRERSNDCGHTGEEAAATLFLRYIRHGRSGPLFSISLRLETRAKDSDECLERVAVTHLSDDAVVIGRLGPLSRKVLQHRPDEVHALMDR